MATPADVDKDISSQEESRQKPLNDGLKDANRGSVGSASSEDRTTSGNDVSGDNGSGKENNQFDKSDGTVMADVVTKEGAVGTNESSDHTVGDSKSKFADATQPLDQTSNIPDFQKQDTDTATEASLPESPPEALQKEETNTGDSTPVLDGASTPPTPRSTPAKPSVFKKTSSLQKVNLNKDFLKNVIPSPSGSQPISTTPRPLANEKPKGTSSVAAKALKPMVRSRLSNMGGASMQRQGSGSSTPKSGRGSSPNFGRAGTGSDVWSWRRQPAAAREYSEEELQKQGVHLTARLTASTGDDANKWADMDDDWSEEEVEETKEVFESPDLGPQNDADEPAVPLAPHLLESAVIGHVVDKQEETIIVSKNERFADVTYDRRQTGSPDEIHGQRQIYNPKIGKFEDVPPSTQTGREQERSRKNVEIMQRGQRRGSSATRRRDSLAKGEELRQGRGQHVENRGYPPSAQRRTSFAERDLNNTLLHRRRDSFISNSAVSDAGRSISNASPSVDPHSLSDQPTAADIIALQQKEMAESRKRALERRARDEEERIAAADRARKKASELAAMASAESGLTKVEAQKASPSPSKASPIPPKVSPVPPKASPAPAISKSLLSTEDIQLRPGMDRIDSGPWTANRDQEEIIRKDSPSKEETLPKRSAWGAIGSSQTNTPSKHQQNGLFGNPNTLAAINHTIGGDAPRRGKNAPRPARVAPTNVPASLQGWASFAGNTETRKAHDDERQQERNRERERLEKEKGMDGPRTPQLVDKWKRVEIKEPENAGDVAGRTVVSVLKSGYVEDASGNLEVRELPVPLQKGRSDPTSQGLSNLLASESTTPALGSPTQGLGMRTPTQPTLGDKAPGSRDRSRFFPSPTSAVVDMSSRLVHPIQPSHSDKSVFAPTLFSSFEDLGKSPPMSNAAISPLPGAPGSLGLSTQTQPALQRQHIPPFGQYGQAAPMSPGQSLSGPAPIGGMTPRNAFSHTVPMSPPPPPSASKYVTKIPTAAEFEEVMKRIRQTMTVQVPPVQESSNHLPTKEDLTPNQHEDVSPLVKRDAMEPQERTDVVEPQMQTQTRTESDAVPLDVRPYMKISAISPRRDLEISTRDVDDEPLPKATVKVSLPKQFYSSSRDINIPIEASSRPKINLPTNVASHTNTPDAKSRIKAIDHALYHHSHRTPNHHNQQSFKIEFAPSLRPNGGVVPNLVKKDRNNHPYVNYEAKPEALTLPAFAHDNELFYPHRDKPFVKHFKAHKFNNKNQHRKPSKTDRIVTEGSSSSQGSKVAAGPSRAPEKK